jgi:hypothetical protein
VVSSKGGYCAGASERATRPVKGAPLAPPIPRRSRDDGTHGIFVEFEPTRWLKLRHRIDFTPGVEPYDTDMPVEFISDGARVRTVVEIEPHRDEHRTRMSAPGFREPADEGSHGAGGAPELIVTSQVLMPTLSR